MGPVDARSTRARATEATRRARDRSEDSRARSISKPSKRVESNDTTMGVDASDDATSRARRVSTTSTSERRGTVMMSIAVMAVSSLMTLGIKRGVEGRGSSAFATPFKAALGQRMKHSTWDESNQHDGGNAADDGFVSYEQQRDFDDASGRGKRGYLAMVTRRWISTSTPSRRGARRFGGTRRFRSSFGARLARDTFNCTSKKTYAMHFARRDSIR